MQAVGSKTEQREQRLKKFQFTQLVSCLDLIPPWRNSFKFITEIVVGKGLL